MSNILLRTINNTIARTNSGAIAAINEAPPDPSKVRIGKHYYPTVKIRKFILDCSKFV